MEPPQVWRRLERYAPPDLLDRLRGRPFRLWKFCTMVTNGDELLEAYLAKNRAARKEWKKYRKLKGFDPRVTVVGRPGGSFADSVCR